jgi:hypothetical protein
MHGGRHGFYYSHTALKYRCASQIRLAVQIPGVSLSELLKDRHIDRYDRQ